jgi:hypothetical protein
LRSVTNSQRKSYPLTSTLGSETTHESRTHSKDIFSYSSTAYNPKPKAIKLVSPVYEPISPTMPPKDLNFITSNANKLAEVHAIFGHIIPLRSQSLDITEIQGTIEDISKDKCRRAAEIVRILLNFLDDQSQH